ncbi:MAG: phospho-N-acetylmuramoyl-pentapeptide-transferase [Erysipelotrichaceae bacterium]|nr:phospho-N-acetylmuramoyl-pentapeptide-transferase [Erysipelotrichaceae bacterium]
MNLISLFISFVVTVLIYPKFIKQMDRLNTHQSVSEYSLEQFKSKKKTPTMGGILFVLVPLILALILQPKSFMDLKMGVVYLTYLGYGLIGFWDDYKIVVEKNNAGLKPSHKFLAQLILAIIVYLIYQSFANSEIVIPFIVNPLNLGWLYGLLVFVMFTGASNGVNITDGMDGLAGGTVLIALFGFFALTYSMNLYWLSNFILMVLGSLAAYLVYNIHPAKIIMGDTGSLALGALLAVIAMVIKQEFLLIIFGAVFVIETLCVMIQIGSVKLFKRRVFKYTPIHYAFTLSGWKETRVVTLFWIVGILFALLGLLLGAQ